MLWWRICFAVRQEKPALTKVPGYKEFGNSIGLRYFSPRCSLLVSLGCSAVLLEQLWIQSQLTWITTLWNRPRKGSHFIATFLQIKVKKQTKKHNKLRQSFISVHSRAPPTVGQHNWEGRSMLTGTERDTGNNSTEWTQILSFKISAVWTPPQVWPGD